MSQTCHSERLNIIIDTREQQPWHFPLEYAVATRSALPAGDYALLEDPEFAIERKSLDDFVSTIVRDWTRLMVELTKLNQPIIIVEANYEDIIMHRYMSPSKPAFVISKIASLTMQNIHVIFAGDAISAAGYCYMLLRKHRDELRRKQ